jgi:hypothetical protein
MAGPATDDELGADEYVRRLKRACERFGYLATILEPSTRLDVSLGDGRAFTHETVTLKPDGNNRLTWWWSWDKPMVPAEEITEAARRISSVLEETRR